MQQVERRNLKVLGERIKELRKKKSKSLNQFVFNHSELTSATWSRIENGKVDLKFNTLIKVAHALDIKIDELVKNINLQYIFEE